MNTIYYPQDGIPEIHRREPLRIRHAGLDPASSCLIRLDSGLRRNDGVLSLRSTRGRGNRVVGRGSWYVVRPQGDGEGNYELLEWSKEVRDISNPSNLTAAYVQRLG